MATSLAWGSYVITSTQAGTEAVVIKDGAVFQRDGEIVDVGRYDELIAKYAPDEVMGSVDHAVIPGLVNAHHHVGLTPFQLGSQDAPLETWLTDRLGARDVDPYLDTLYSAFEMIESGITTVQHLQGARLGPPAKWSGVIKQVIQAYADIGMRVSYALGMRDQNRLVYGPDEEFVTQLPPDLCQDVSALLRDSRTSIEEQLASVFVEPYEAFGRNGSERVRLWLSPVNLERCSNDGLLTIKECAKKYGVGIHMHMLETPYQQAYARKRFGTTAGRGLHSLGILGPEVTLGHGVWLTQDEIELLAETGTSVCHNASSNLRLQSGIAPLNQLLDLGVRVAIGIDEAGINDDRDMLQELRLVLKLHRIPGIGRKVPTASQVFEMATANGAETTGFGTRIGSLAPGKAADLVILNLGHTVRPYRDPEIPLLDAIMQRARASDVETVIIAGEVVLRDRRFTKIDKEAVLRELTAALAVPPGSAEIDRRRLSRRLLPHVRMFYEGWELEDGEPHYKFNRRG